MRFEHCETVMTPSEADYLERICMYRSDDSQAAALQWKLQTAALAWILSVLPSEMTDLPPANGTFPFLKGFALRMYKTTDEEVVRVSLTDWELSILHMYTLQDVELTFDTATNFGPEHSLEDLNRIIAESEAHIGPVTNDELESINSSLFAADLRRLAVGQSIIKTLAERA